jgi:hypothetical protein
MTSKTISHLTKRWDAIEKKKEELKNALPPPLVIAEPKPIKTRAAKKFNLAPIRDEIAKAIATSDGKMLESVLSTWFVVQKKASPFLAVRSPRLPCGLPLAWLFECYESAARRYQAVIAEKFDGTLSTECAEVFSKFFPQHRDTDIELVPLDVAAQILDTTNPARFITAVRAGDGWLFDSALKDTKFVDTADANGFTALMHASVIGKGFMVEELWKVGANQAAKDVAFGITAAHLAACRDPPATVICDAVDKAGLTASNVYEFHKK